MQVVRPVCSCKLLGFTLEIIIWLANLKMRTLYLNTRLFGGTNASNLLLVCLIVIISSLHKIQNTPFISNV